MRLTLCILEQWSLRRIDTVVGMQLEHMKTAIVGGWVLGLGAFAVSLNMGSATGWMLFVGLGLVPPLMLFGLWHQPAQTMSESIREVLR
jgi:hypothetical protein